MHIEWMRILFEDFNCLKHCCTLQYNCSVFKILATEGTFWLKLQKEQIESLPEGVSSGRGGGQGLSRLPNLTPDVLIFPSKVAR
jgi:hypothetical protein